MIRGYSKGAGGFGFTVWGDKASRHAMVDTKVIYRELLKQVIRMFDQRTPPLDLSVTLEMINFIACARRSLEPGTRIFLDENRSRYA